MRVYVFSSDFFGDPLSSKTLAYKTNTSDWQVLDKRGIFYLEHECYQVVTPTALEGETNGDGGIRID